MCAKAFFRTAPADLPLNGRTGPASSTRVIALVRGDTLPCNRRDRSRRAILPPPLALLFRDSAFPRAIWSPNDGARIRAPTRERGRPGELARDACHDGVERARQDRNSKTRW